MKLHRRLVTGAVPVVAALAFIVGCGGNGGDGSGQNRGTGTVDTNATLTVGIDQDIGSLDPRVNHGVLTVRPMFNAYEGLVTKTWYKGDDQLQLEPALAESWKVSDDGKTYTFKLRDGVKFHDGTPFDADAMVFHMRTLLDPKFEYYYEEAGPFAKSRLPNVVGYEAPDPHTFVLKLSRPDGNVLDVLGTNQEFWPTSPTAVKKYGNAGIGKAHPVGTGPFKFVSYDPGQQIVFERNDDYWRGPAKIKRLIEKVYADEAARTAALEGGTINIATNVSVKNESRWAGRDDLELIIRKQPTIKTCILDATSGPGQSKEFREAFSLAANRDAMNATVYQGKSAPSNGLYPAASPAYDSGMPKLAYDPEKAKQLIEQSGFAGAKLVLESTTGDQNANDTYAVFQENLRQVGLDAKVKYVDGPTYVADLTAPKPMSDRGIDGFCATSMGTDTLSLLFDILAKRGFPPAGYNAYRYVNPAVEQAVVQARDATDYDSWVAAHAAANKALAEDFAGAFLIDDVQGFGMASNIDWTPAAARAYMFYSAQVRK